MKNRKSCTQLHREFNIYIYIYSLYIYCEENIKQRLCASFTFILHRVHTKKLWAEEIQCFCKMKPHTITLYKSIITATHLEFWFLTKLLFSLIKKMSEFNCLTHRDIFSESRTIITVFFYSNQISIVRLGTKSIRKV